MEEKERIIRLSNLFGPSGFEDEVSAFVISELSEYETQQDHMRNVRVVKPGRGPRLMLDAHLDEVGVQVQAVKPDGTLRFLTLGGIRPAALAGSLFRLRNAAGEDVKAVVAAKPPHFMKAEEAARPLDIEDMILDCGTSSQTATAQLGLGIGTPGVPDVTCIYDEKQGLFLGKAFDDRIGAAALIEVMKRLAGENLPNTLCASFSSQEEVGERGIRASARAIEPQVMIAFEGCPADDTFSPDYMIQSAMGRGVMLRNRDVSMVTNWRFQKWAVETAGKYGIPVQQSVRRGGGTNAAAVNIEFGVPAIVIGIPVRYAHSCWGWVSFHDYQAAVELGCALARELDEKVLASL
jgi:putative aminopeptidase FrvX